MGAYDAAPGFRDLIEKKISETVFGETIGYDFGPALLPVEPGKMPMVVYVLTLSCRSPLLVPPMIVAPSIIMDGYPTADQIRTSVSQSITALFEARAKVCSAWPGRGPN